MHPKLVLKYEQVSWYLKSVMFKEMLTIIFKTWGKSYIFKFVFETSHDCSIYAKF